MARPSNASIFLMELKEFGGAAANGALRQKLEWPEEKYWRVQEELIDAGAIVRGRGRGGRVIINSPQSNEAVPAIVQNLPSHDSSAVADVLTEVVHEAEASPPPRELDLYPPIEKELPKFLKRQKKLQECCCQITALQGRRDTGGSWSRPDLVAVGVKTYEYLPNKSLEIYSFEVKASNDISVKGVLEALSHRESATHSYVIYHTDGRDWENLPEVQRIEQLAARHGVGIIVAGNVADANDWDERLTATRSNADPDTLDHFIGSVVRTELKSQIRRWTR